MITVSMPQHTEMPASPIETAIRAVKPMRIRRAAEKVMKPNTIDTSETANPASAGMIVYSPRNTSSDTAMPARERGSVSGDILEN